MAIGGKALIANTAVGAWQIIEQHFAAILLKPGLGRIGGNGQQPGLEAGAPLKAMQMPHHGQPGVLHRLIGMTAADDGISHRAHAALIGADQLAKCPLLSRPQAREQGAVGGVIH